MSRQDEMEGGGRGRDARGTNCTARKARTQETPEQRHRCIPIVLCDVRQVEFQPEFHVILSVQALSKLLIHFANTNAMFKDSHEIETDLGWCHLYGL